MDMHRLDILSQLESRIPSTLRFILDLLKMHLKENCCRKANILLKWISARAHTHAHCTSSMNSNFSWFYWNSFKKEKWRKSFDFHHSIQYGIQRNSKLIPSGKIKIDSTHRIAMSFFEDQISAYRANQLKSKQSKGIHSTLKLYFP